MKKSPFINRNEIARHYGISTKTLTRNLKRHGLDLGNTRAISPKDVARIIDAFGPWMEPD